MEKVTDLEDYKRRKRNTSIFLFYKEKLMPCCMSKYFHEGPSGGLSTNIKCAECGQKWNITPSLGLIEKI